MSIPRSVVVLGGSGFIGQAVVPAAVAAGIHVLAVARSDTSAAIVAALGAHPVRGDVGSPSGWMAQCAGTDAMVDLTQPDVPARVTVRAIGRMAESRVAMTRAMLEALATLSPSMRPLWISVSGTDDLLPDSSGVLSSRSGLRSAPAAPPRSNTGDPTTSSSPTPEAPIRTIYPRGVRSATPHVAPTRSVSGTRPTA